jgi:predicted kinase
MKSLGLSKPHLIVMVGIPGSGKSFFAEHFAETFKAPIISLERLCKDLFKSPTFNKTEEEITNRVADYMLDEMLKTERTVIYDGQSNTRTERDLITKKARNSGYEPLFVWTQTEQIAAKKRAIKPSSDKLPITLEQFEDKLKRFSAPYRTENTIVISGKHTYSSQLKIVLKYLVEPRDQMGDHSVKIN